MSAVQVAVGVIVKDNHVFICRRAATAHQGGLWEFPGGKIENGENVEQALHRELDEEIGIEVLASRPLLTLNHQYADKAVTLHVRMVTAFNGMAHGKEGQLSKWLDINELEPQDFPQANLTIIDALKEQVTR